MNGVAVPFDKIAEYIRAKGVLCAVFLERADWRDEPYAIVLPGRTDFAQARAAREPHHYVGVYRADHPEFSDEALLEDIDCVAGVLNARGLW